MRDKRTARNYPTKLLKGGKLKTLIKIIPVLLIQYLFFLPITKVAIADNVDKSWPTCLTRFELGLMGGLAFNSGLVSANFSNGDPKYDIGFGGNIRGIFPLNETFGLGATLGLHLMTERYFFNGLISEPGSFEQKRIFFLGTLKINLWDPRIFHPYLLGGIGPSWISDFGYYYSDIMLQAGVGLEIPSGENFGFFVEGKINCAFGLDLRFPGSESAGGSSGNYFLYVPVDAGIVFKP